MKGFTVILCLTALFSCSKSNSTLDPKIEASTQAAIDSHTLKLLYLVDGTEVKTQQELLAIMKKEHTITVYTGHSTLAHKYGERAKFGVAVVTTK